MLKTLAVLLVLAGCGGGAATPAAADTMTAATAPASLLGAWVLYSENGGGLAQPCQTPVRRGVVGYCDRRTFNADGSWLREITYQETSTPVAQYTGRWTLSGDVLVVNAAAGTSWTGATALVACGMASNCLELSGPAAVDVFRR